MLTHQENAQNQPAHRRWSRSGRHSKFRGVHWDIQRGKWKVTIQCAGVAHNLGYFTDELEAARSASAWRKEHMPFSVEPGGDGASHFSHRGDPEDRGSDVRVRPRIGGAILKSEGRDDERP